MTLLTECWDMEVPDLLISITGGEQNVMMPPNLVDSVILLMGLAANTQGNIHSDIGL